MSPIALVTVLASARIRAGNVVIADRVFIAVISGRIVTFLDIGATCSIAAKARQAEATVGSFRIGAQASYHRLSVDADPKLAQVYRVLKIGDEFGEVGVAVSLKDLTLDDNAP